MDKLAIPASAADLYLYQGAEVSACRPVMTGDVFSDIDIPGVDDGRGLALVLAHPCSMRGVGGHLRDKVMMCRVSDGSGIPIAKWASRRGASTTTTAFAPSNTTPRNPGRPSYLRCRCSIASAAIPSRLVRATGAEPGHMLRPTGAPWNSVGSGVGTCDGVGEGEQLNNIAATRTSERGRADIMTDSGT